MDAPGRLLGSGKEAEVFEYGDLALKLYRPGASKASPFREAANLAIIERHALPAPKVHGVDIHADRWGLLMDRAAGPSFGDAAMSPSPRPVLDKMARLHRMIHEKPGYGLPSLKTRLSMNILRADGLDAALRHRLVQTLAGLPDGDRLCHGDFHPWNIHGKPDEVMIVDWLDACIGSSAADVCRTYVLLRHVDPAMALLYVDIYANLAEVETEEIFSWLPLMAAARLAEGVAAEQEDLLLMASQTSVP